MSQPQNFNPNHVVGAKSSQSQFKQTNQKTKLRNFEEQQLNIKNKNVTTSKL